MHNGRKECSQGANIIDLKISKNASTIQVKQHVLFTVGALPAVLSPQSFFSLPSNSSLFARRFRFSLTFFFFIYNLIKGLQLFQNIFWVLFCAQLHTIYSWFSWNLNNKEGRLCHFFLIKIHPWNPLSLESCSVSTV